ncbi:DUF1428 domain-containing protein [Thalassococcus sp. S3]|uniref:DUF1428 domain-containing protein n=1 Tax=Thalassococcus sp. S3 TaxID=2017482 RepID=UPI0010245BB0|nr:DUF1428 domain-containing protein [Thalassococcus sp. S3]QBF29833.1 RNA signal recognition particle [Thalassococcus sp. S3]
MPYIQGFLSPVPVDQKAAYIEMAEKAWPIFQDYGALSTRECWGEDVPDGEHTSFPMAVKAEKGEVVAFSWIEWRDKAAYEACAASMETDPRWQEMGDPSDAPFDMKRMMWGGFEVIFNR